MSELLMRMTDEQIEALLRAAKTRARAFFAHPKAMIALREEAMRRRAQRGN